MRTLKLIIALLLVSGCCLGQNSQAEMAKARIARIQQKDDSLDQVKAGLDSQKSQQKAKDTTRYRKLTPEDIHVGNFEDSPLAKTPAGEDLIYLKKQGGKRMPPIVDRKEPPKPKGPVCPACKSTLQKKTVPVKKKCFHCNGKGWYGYQTKEISRKYNVLEDPCKQCNGKKETVEKEVRWVCPGCGKRYPIAPE